MKTVQLALDEDLVAEVDKAAQQLGASRSASSATLSGRRSRNGGSGSWNNATAKGTSATRWSLESLPVRTR